MPVSQLLSDKGPKPLTGERGVVATKGSWRNSGHMPADGCGRTLTSRRLQSNQLKTGQGPRDKGYSDDLLHENKGFSS